MSSIKNKVESPKTLSQKIRGLFKKENEPQFSAWNPYSNEGIDDEYYINEIIGIEELPYDEFIKDKGSKDEIPF